MAERQQEAQAGHLGQFDGFDTQAEGGGEVGEVEHDARSDFDCALIAIRGRMRSLSCETGGEAMFARGDPRIM